MKWLWSKWRNLNPELNWHSSLGELLCVRMRNYACLLSARIIFAIIITWRHASRSPYVYCQSRWLSCNSAASYSLSHYLLEQTLKVRVHGYHAWSRVYRWDIRSSLCKTQYTVDTGKNASKYGIRSCVKSAPYQRYWRNPVYIPCAWKRTT